MPQSKTSGQHYSIFCTFIHLGSTKTPVKNIINIIIIRPGFHLSGSDWIGSERN